MAEKRIADDFLYGDREKRKERRTLRRKNIIERRLYKKNARRMGDPSSYTDAMIDQMKLDDKGEMQALKYAQEMYTPIFNAQSNFSNSLKNLNTIETQLHGEPQTLAFGSPAGDDQSIINVPDDKNKRRPIKNLITNIKEGIKTRNLRKQSLKKEYNNFIEDMKLIEGENFDPEKVPSYRKWKRKWNAGDFIGTGLPEEDRERLLALKWNRENPDNQKVFHEGKYIFRSELEKIIDPTTGANIKEREQSFLDNMPENFTSFGHLMAWQQKAGDYRFKEGESIQVAGKNYTWKKGSGWTEEAPPKEDKSLYSYRKVWDLYDEGKGPLGEKWYGDLSSYFAKYAPDYDYSSSTDEEDFNKYVEISKGWWESDAGKEYKSKYNIKRKNQMGGIRQYKNGGERKVTRNYVDDAKSKKVVKTNKKGTTTTTEKISQYNEGYLGHKPKNIKYGDKNIWSKKFKSKVNKDGEETKRREKIVYDDGKQMKKRNQRKVRWGKNKGKIKIKTTHWKDGKRTRTVEYKDATDQSLLKKGGKHKKKQGMYQDGGFLSPPIPRLFE